MTHGDQGGHQTAVAVRLRHARQEAAVELEAVHRQFTQVGEAGIAHPKVIDGDAHAQGPQLAQHIGRAQGLTDHHAFGDLELQCRGRQTGIFQHARHGVCDVLPVQLHRRQVHRDAQRKARGLSPTVRDGTGLAQHPFTDRDDQAGLFGQRDEV